MSNPWQPQDPRQTPFVPPPHPLDLPPLPTDPVPGAAPDVPAENTAAQVPASISVKQLIQIIAGVAVALVVGWIGWSQYSDYRDAKKLDELTSRILPGALSLVGAWDEYRRDGVRPDGCRRYAGTR